MVGALPFVFLIVANKPAVGVAFLFIGFFSLIFFLTTQNKAETTSTSSWYRFSKVVLHAFFKKLPIKPNPASDIRSIPPTDFIIERKDTPSTDPNGGKRHDSENDKSEENTNKR